jgi:uncharacterized phiE125 gp8 family phage protein
MSSITWTTLVGPPVEPVTKEQMYLQLRLDADPDGTHPDDTMINAQITASRLHVEAILRRSLVTRTLRQNDAGFPFLRVLFSGVHAWGDDDDYASRPTYIELYQPPVQAVTAIRYYDDSNELQTLNPDWYLVDYAQVCPRISLKDGYDWPTTYRRTDAVQIEYIAGYAATGSPGHYADNIPQPILEAIKLHVQLQYDQLDDKQAERIRTTIALLLAPYRVHNLNFNV